MFLGAEGTANSVLDLLALLVGCARKVEPIRMVLASALKLQTATPFSKRNRKKTPSGAHSKPTSLLSHSSPKCTEIYSLVPRVDPTKDISMASFRGLQGLKLMCRNGSSPHYSRSQHLFCPQNAPRLYRGCIMRLRPNYC